LTLIPLIDAVALVLGVLSVWMKFRATTLVPEVVPAYWIPDTQTAAEAFVLLSDWIVFDDTV
jgi:hypothetical protein